MRLRWGIVIGAVVTAAAAHFIVARVVRGTPLLGAGGFAREMAAALDRPGTEDDAGGRPLRVSFGTADRTPARAPDPRATLDPAPLRRPPQAGADWPGLPDITERLAACAVELSRERGEERDAPRVSPPGLAAPFATRALASSSSSSSADLAAARDAIALNVKAATRPLPARFRPGDAPSLARAAKTQRPSLGAGGAHGTTSVRLDIPSSPGPLQPPADWPAHNRAIAAPEIFIDVTTIEVTAIDVTAIKATTEDVATEDVATEDVATEDVTTDDATTVDE